MYKVSALQLTRRAACNSDAGQEHQTKLTGDDSVFLRVVGRLYSEKVQNPHLPDFLIAWTIHEIGTGDSTETIAAGAMDSTQPAGRTVLSQRHKYKHKT